MSTSLSSLQKLSKIQLPNGSFYRLQDRDLREMVGLVDYSTNTAYNKDVILYDATGDCLYVTKETITAAQNTSLSDLVTANKIATTTITAEIERRYNYLLSLISGGTHFVGKTTTALTDGATTNPIIINGNSYTAITGDIVIAENGSGQADDAEFIFDGTYWNEFGTPGLLKALAFADTASATYVKPTGSGTVTVPVVSISGGNDSAITQEGTTDIAYVSGFTGSTSFATEGIKNVTITGTNVFNTDAIKSASLTGETEFVTSAINGATLTGDITFVTSAINGVSIVDNSTVGTSVVDGITGTVEFNTDAIKSAALTSSQNTSDVVIGLTGTTTFATEGIRASVDLDECLTFETVSVGSFGVNTTQLGVTTTLASKATFGVITKNLDLVTTAASVGTVGLSVSQATTGVVGITTTAAATASFAVSSENAQVGSFATTSKHIHVIPGTTITNISVETTNATITVTPDTVTA